MEKYIRNCFIVYSLLFPQIQQLEEEKSSIEEAMKELGEVSVVHIFIKMLPFRLYLTFVLTFVK